MRSTLIRAVLVAALALITTLGLMGSGTATASTPVTATTDVNVRARPSTSAQVLGSLHRGQTVRATSDRDGWTRISFHSRTAYVASRFLAGGDDLPAGTAVGRGTTRTTTAAVRLRRGPSLTDDVVTVLGQGVTVVQTGKTARGWTEVTYARTRGWVSSQYLTAARNGLPGTVGARRTTADLNVRSTSADDGRLLGLVRQGSTVSITGATDHQRAQIVWHGRVGWVLAKYLANGGSDGPKTPPLPKVTGYRYATTALTVRTTSGSDYRALGDIAKGTRVSITGLVRNQRAQILYRGAVRWVTARYLTTQPPSSGGGAPGVENGLKPNARKVLAAVRTSWPQIRTILGVHPDPLPDHPSGRALDLMLPDYRSASGRQLGHELSRWLQARHAELGINYIIYDQKIWNVRRDKDGWRPMGNRGSDSANHKNHVHVTVFAQGYAPI